MPWSSECSVVVGDLVVDSTSNITESQLQNLFQNVTSVQGSVTVRNTTLKQLSFLKNIEILTRGYLDNVLEIVGNPLLTQIQIDRLNRSDGIVVITDNRELDVKKYCQLFDRVLLGNRIILRNKGNCAIPPERLSVLRSVKKLYGCLTVYVTNFETLSFLENLEEIICQSRTDTAVWITTNHYMENLGLRKLTKIVTQRQLEIVSNRILQITIEEAEIFASASVGGDRVQGIFSTGP
ncbi:hypothetical protein RB195_005547 [Necator americanus]|uniref:Receptor L-domain domain-containing protein n=1 Tax=Necator americanus TaxID=51031 RepID=A0ABR1BSD2_NECAM